MSIRILQNPSNTRTSRPELWGKWWASRLTDQIDYYDVEYDEDEDGRPIHRSEASQRSEYIGPGGKWQDNTYYFVTSDECIAALALAGITDVEIVAWVERPRRHLPNTLQNIGRLA